jgi:hypothetical protein
LFSEDYVKIRIIFSMGGIGKICSRGIYQNEEERIIFCSKEEIGLGSATYYSSIIY